MQKGYTEKDSASLYTVSQGIFDFDFLVDTSNLTENVHLAKGAASKIFRKAVTRNESQPSCIKTIYFPEVSSCVRMIYFPKVLVCENRKRWNFMCNMKTACVACIILIINTICVFACFLKRVKNSKISQKTVRY